MPDPVTRNDDRPVPDAQEPVPDAQEPVPDAQEPVPAGESADERAGGTATTTRMPEYKGEPLDAERGPGLGCFWVQVALLTFFLVFTPLTVTWGWDPFISGTLLIVTLVLLLVSGQTIIFLLRLVAADRRARRTPLSPSARPTVGQMEDAARPAEPPPATASTSDDDGASRTTRPQGER